MYHSFQEFCQRISKLKLPVGWSINISEFAYIKKSDDIHDLPQFEIIVDLNLALRSEHLHCLSHQIMTSTPHIKIQLRILL